MIILYTSNILQHKLPNDASLSTAVCHMIDHWSESNKNGKKTINTTNNQSIQFIPSFQPKLINSTTDDVTVKVFLSSKLTVNSINQYIDEILSTLDDHFLDVSKRIGLFIISIDGCSTQISRKNAENPPSLEDIVKVWITASTRALKTAEKHGISIEKLGTTELSASELSSLIAEINSHHSKSLLPGTESIYSDDCCKLPQNLLQITEKNNIKMIPHRDRVFILPEKDLNTVLKKTDLKQDYSWSWIARFTAINKERQILTNTEFLIKLQEN